MNFQIAFFVGAPLLVSLLLYIFQKRETLQVGLFSVLQISTILNAGYFLFSDQVFSRASLPLGNWPTELAISFSLEALSALLITVSATVLFSGGLLFFTERRSRKNKSKMGFTVLSLLQLGLNGSFLTADIFNLFVFFEILLIAALVLIISERHPQNKRSAVFYLGMNFMASALFLLGVGVIYQQTGVLSFERLAEKLPDLSFYSRFLMGGLFLVSFATKSALIPFAIWLPQTYPWLGGAIGGIFGGLLTKVGLYALMKVLFLLFPLGGGIFWIVLLLAILSMLLGVFSAYAQKDIRSILSFHIISQVGYIAGGIALVGLSPSREVQIIAMAAVVFYFAHHILVKSNLFFASSWIESVAGSQKLDKLQGLSHRWPFLAFLFAVPALSLAGLPPFSGFWAKLAIVQSAFSIENWAYVVAALLAGLFTFLSMLKIWQKAFLGSKPKEAELKIPSASTKRIWIFALLIPTMATLLISFYPYLLLEISYRASESFFALLKGGSF